MSAAGLLPPSGRRSNLTKSEDKRGHALRMGWLGFGPSPARRPSGGSHTDTRSRRGGSAAGDLGRRGRSNNINDDDNDNLLVRQWRGVEEGGRRGGRVSVPIHSLSRFTRPQKKNEIFRGEMKRKDSIFVQTNLRGSTVTRSPYEDLQRLWVIRGQCCLRVAAGPCLPNSQITQFNPYFTRNPCKITAWNLLSPEIEHL